MNACQMTLFPVFRKNFIATDALFPYLTASVPLLLAYNRLEIAFHIQICVFIAVSYDFLIEKIISARFQIRGISLIGRIMQYTRYLAVFPAHQPGTVLTFQPYQFVAYLRHPLARGIHIVNHTHRFRLFGIDDISPFRFIAVISENISVSEQYTFVAAYFLPRADSFGNFTALFLRQCRHNRKSQFAVSVHRPDIVFHKIHFHTIVFQLTRNDERINRISCKTAYFARYDQVKFLLFCILHHLQKRRSFLRLRACDALIRVSTLWGTQ